MNKTTTDQSAKIDKMTGNQSPADLIVDLCRLFYQLGWVTGTGGGMSIRDSNTIYIAPSGVQKERMATEDIFMEDVKTGQITYSPSNLKMSACAPLFRTCYLSRPSTRACIHSHSINAVLVTLLCRGSEAKFSHLEMIKGIKRGESGRPFKFSDTLTVPIIENTENEEDLSDSLQNAIKDNPDTNAVLVRRHGVYVWGDSWERAKCMTECYDYLFQCLVEMHKLGLSESQ